MGTNNFPQSASNNILFLPTWGKTLSVWAAYVPLPFPVALKMPVIGLIYATRHRDTPLISTLRAKVRELLNRPGLR